MKRLFMLSVLCLFPFFSGGCIIFWPHVVSGPMGVDGRAIDKESGKPIANVQVSRMGFDKTRTDRDGRFHLAQKYELRLFVMAPNDDNIGGPPWERLELRAPGYRTHEAGIPSWSNTDEDVFSEPRKGKAPLFIIRMTPGSEKDPPMCIGFGRPQTQPSQPACGSFPASSPACSSLDDACEHGTQ